MRSWGLRQIKFAGFVGENRSNYEYVGLVLAAFESCNVVRTITTTAQTVQKGDTTVVIMTKTVEQYDGNLDATKLLQAGAMVK